MEKTIIAIYGKQNTGKSETIKNVCKEIIDRFPNAQPSRKEINYSNDILLTIQLGNIKIGIESQGDPGSRILTKDTLKMLADKKFSEKLGGCDIIICATRTDGATVKKVDEIADKYDYHTLWTSSFWSPYLNPVVLNRIAALNIVEIIKSLIIEQLAEK